MIGLGEVERIGLAVRAAPEALDRPQARGGVARARARATGLTPAAWRLGDGGARGAEPIESAAVVPRALPLVRCSESQGDGRGEGS